MPSLTRRHTLRLALLLTALLCFLQCSEQPPARPLAPPGEFLSGLESTWRSPGQAVRFDFADDRQYHFVWQRYEHGAIHSHYEGHLQVAARHGSGWEVHVTYQAGWMLSRAHEKVLLESPERDLGARLYLDGDRLELFGQRFVRSADPLEATP